MIALALVLAALAAEPPIPPAQRLPRAKLCLDALDYSCAERELAHAREALETFAPADRQEILRLSAETALSEARPDDAKAHLLALLALDPRFDPGPDAWPPAWRAVLDAARRDAPDRLPPELEVEAPTEVDAGKGFELVARARDDSGVGAVTLFVAGRRLPMATTDNETWRALVPAELVAGDTVGLYVEATDRHGNGPARWMSADKPFRVVVRAETVTLPPPPQRPPDEGSDPSVTETWWFWTAIGAAAIATGVTVWALTRGAEDEPAVGTSPIAVELQWPAP